MNDLELMWELGQETPLPVLDELSLARDRLAAAIAAEPAASPAGMALRRWPWRVRRMIPAVAAVGVIAVATAIAVVVLALPAGPRPDPAAARILGKAALAALRLPDGAPRPDQFVYTKMENGDGSLYQSWLSVDGTRTGLVTGAGGGQTIRIEGCRNGKQLVHPQDNPHAPLVWQTCIPAPAYLPGMPANAKALRAYFREAYRIQPGEPGYLNGLGKQIMDLLEQAYLSSGQRAALYELMADTPGFSAVPHAADIIGRPGIGIAWPAPGGGGRDMIVFDARTYTELGVTTWGAGNQKEGSALLKIAIVNKPGQLP